MQSKKRGKRTIDQHKHHIATFIIHNQFGEISMTFHFTKTQQGRIQIPYDAAKEHEDVDQDKRETNN